MGEGKFSEAVVIVGGSLQVSLWVCSISSQLWPCLSHVFLGHYNGYRSPTSLSFLFFSFLICPHLRIAPLSYSFLAALG